MATKRFLDWINSLSSASDLSSAFIPIVQSGATKKASPNLFGGTPIHLVGSSSAPTIAVGAGAGSTGGTPSASLSNATDISGLITVNTVGTTTTGDLCTITFNSAWTNAPNIILWPANGNSTPLFLTVAYCTSTTTTFIIKNSGLAWPTSTQLKWFYHAIG